MRKATDIILELENNVKHLVSLINNQDFLIKGLYQDSKDMKSLIKSLIDEVKELKSGQNAQILQNNQKMPALPSVSAHMGGNVHPPISSGSNVPLKKEEPKKKENKKEEIIVKDGKLVRKKSVKIDNKQEEIQEIPEFTEIMPQNLSEEPSFGSELRTRGGNSPEETKKTVVTQKIVYEDGKPVCLAKVEIKNTVGDIVSQIRTNATGEWMTTVKPGIYEVIISKLAARDKPAVNMRYPIKIEASPIPVRLETPKHQ